MFIPLLCITYYLYLKNTKLQPYYEINLNSIRGGVFGFLICSCLVGIAQSFVKSGSIIMFIISAAVGLVGFFIGGFVSITFYKKCIEKIYSRYRMSLDIHDPDMISSDDEENEENEEEDEEEDGESGSEDEQQEHLISISEEESQNSDDDEHSSNSGSEEKSEQSSNDEGSDNESYDFNGDDEIVLFNSIYQIGNHQD